MKAAMKSLCLNGSPVKYSAANRRSNEMTAFSLLYQANVRNENAI